MSNKNFGAYTPTTQNQLVQTNPDAAQTITGNLNVSGTLTAGSVIDGGTYAGNLEVDGDLSVTGTLDVTGAVGLTAALALAAAGFTMAAIARTATADGTGTGTIASGPMLQAIAVTAGGDADAIIILPAPTPGTIVILSVAATGYELRTNSPTTVGINGGTGADAESAIPANTTAVLICATATSWKGFQMGSDGTLAKVQVAA
jgi:hypothetical protein